MGISNPDPLDLRIQFEVAKEKLIYSEQKIIQLEQAVADVNRAIGHKESTIEQLRDKRDEWRIKWERLERDYMHSQTVINNANQKVSKKNTNAKTQAFLASLIFLLTSILVNIGTTMLTATPINRLGWVMIALAGAAYIVAALMTTLLALEGGNS